MNKRTAEHLQKHTLLLFEGDWQRLHELYPDVGTAIVIRNLVRLHLAKVDKPLDVSKIKVKEEL